LKIGQALEYLHEIGIIIRDLDNTGILMTEVTKDMKLEGAVPRISRLKQARVMGQDEVTRGIFGDIRFRAPEVVAGKPYDFKADAWSFGVVLFFLLTATYPFDEKSHNSEFVHLSIEEQIL